METKHTHTKKNEKIVINLGIFVGALFGISIFGSLLGAAGTGIGGALAIFWIAGIVLGLVISAVLFLAGLVGAFSKDKAQVQFLPMSILFFVLVLVVGGGSCFLNIALDPNMFNGM
jgi:hypothetical protein